MWIGQEVINDLEDDGLLSFDLGDNKIIEIAPPEDVKAAILENRSTYLMGTIGPDAVPDMVAGQMVVHPGGIENGSKDAKSWYSSQWLEYLLKKGEHSTYAKAFAHGYLTHAASDVFSHTYINQYSGEVFSLMDGTQSSEFRHIKLEQFIADRTPPLRDHEGNLLKPYAEQITLDAAYGAFVRDILVYDDEIQSQYLRTPGGQHLYTIAKLKESVKTLAQEDVWGDIDQKIIDMVANYYNYPLSDEDIETVLELLEKVINKTNENIDKQQEYTEKLYKFLSDVDNTRFTDLANALTEMQSVETDALASFQKYRKKLEALKPDPPECPKTEKVCHWVEGHYVPGPGMVVDTVCMATRNAAIEYNEKIIYKAVPSCRKYDYPCKEARKRIIQFNNKLKPKTVPSCPKIPGTVPNGTWVEAATVCSWVTASLDNACNTARNKAIKDNKEALGEVTRLETKALGFKYDFFERAETVRQEAQKIGDALFKIHRLVVELGFALNGSVSPVKGALLNWERDIDKSMSDYGVAMSQTLINTMKKKSLTTQDFEAYSTCNKDELAGVPLQDIETVIRNKGCEATNSVIDFMNKNHLSLTKAIEHEKFFEPAKVWFDCNMPQLEGIPSQLSGCEMRDSMTEIKEAVSKILDLVEPMAVIGESLGVPSRERLEELKNNLVDNIVSDLNEVALRFLEAESGIYFDELFISKDISDTRLQAVFNDDALQPSNLLTIPDVPARVRLEMGLAPGSDGDFDPEKYTVVHNALALSKLSLLDTEGIKTLIAAAGLDPEAYPITVDNVVAGFIGSLDGHHQWMKRNVPKLPSQNDRNCTAYIKPGYSNQKEFILYREEKIQKAIFKKLFTGPLSRGLVGTEKLKDEALERMNKRTLLLLQTKNSQTLQREQGLWEQRRVAGSKKWKRLKRRHDASWQEEQKRWSRETAEGLEMLENLKRELQKGYEEVKNRLEQERAEVKAVESLSFTPECTEAYFPSSIDWR